MSGWLPRMVASPVRMMSWSSAMRTRMVTLASLRGGWWPERSSRDRDLAPPRGSPEQGDTFFHAGEAVPRRPRAERDPVTVVADAQADGLDVTGHLNVDPACVAGVTLGVGDRLLGYPEQCGRDTGAQVVEIASAFDLDPRAQGPVGGGQVLDVGNPASDGHLRGLLAPAKGPDHERISDRVRDASPSMTPSASAAPPRSPAVA